MIAALAVSWAWAQTPADTCARSSVGKVSQGALPGVWVLGERKGTLPDLSRARKIVKKLAKRGPVTLALQAVAQDQQGVLDDFAAGTLALDALPTSLDWEARWGFPFEAYAPLFALGHSDDPAKPAVHLVGIGGEYHLRPQDQPMALPPAYFAILADPMGDNPVPPELETPYAEFVAWADHTFAERALAGWDGQGALVILVDRYHVEGGLGVSWQAQRLTPAPITAVVLADAESRCYAGDVLLH